MVERHWDPAVTQVWEYCQPRRSPLLMGHTRVTGHPEVTGSISEQGALVSSVHVTSSTRCCPVAVGTPVVPTPPAQIRTGSIAAYGSYLGYLALKRMSG